MLARAGNREHFQLAKIFLTRDAANTYGGRHRLNSALLAILAR